MSHAATSEAATSNATTDLGDSDRFDDRIAVFSRNVVHWLISTSTSLTLHFALILLLGLLTLPPVARFRPSEILSGVEKPKDRRAEPIIRAEPPPPPLDIRKETLTVPSDLHTPQQITARVELLSNAASSELVDAPAAVLSLAPPSVETMLVSATGMMKPVGLGEEGLHGELSNRVGGGRYSQALMGGGSRESEDAVDRGLKWLAEHQFPDGSWSYEHSHSGCRGRCTHDGGRTAARNGATGMALLCYLGAGQTHLSGKYQPTVRRGLEFLLAAQQANKDRGSLWEANGQMYGHGIATMALCEAYALSVEAQENKNVTKRAPVTKQQREATNLLRLAAQAALDFIAVAQDAEGGGWRYRPREPGDTSVFGWQLLALKSGNAAGLQISQRTVRKAYDFLDLVQSQAEPVAGVRLPGETLEGAELVKRELPCGPFYGYDKPGRGHATTAIGLLSRMYLGWDRYNPALQKGIEEISKWGPSQKGDMYYNYYATLVMWHTQGAEWRAWNDGLRDWLIKQQSAEGHELGSWYFQGDPHGASAGGRLYCTALSILTLEVYYRFLPLYRRQVKDKGFTQ